MTWLVLERGIPADDAAAIERLAESAAIACELRDRDSLMLIDGVDPEPFLREDRVNDNVSLVSSVPRVREILVDHLRRYAATNDLVMEGRDIGSVVFPRRPSSFTSTLRRKFVSPARGAGTTRPHHRAGRSGFFAARFALDHRRGRARHRQLQPNDRWGRRGNHRPLETKGTNHRTVNPWYFTIYHLTRLVARVFFRFRVVHPERVIQEGPVILAMNHESYLDPPFAGIACRRAIYFLARKTLLDVPVLGWMLPKLNVIPVDQEGGDRSALKALIRILRANHGTLVFPEGSRTLDGHLQPPQPGIGFVIAKTLAPVVPMRFSARIRLCPAAAGNCAFVRSRSWSATRSTSPRPTSRVMGVKSTRASASG